MRSRLQAREGKVTVAEFLLRYADPRGQMHEQVAEAPSEREARERLSQQGYLVYSVRAKDLRSPRLSGITQRRKTVNLEKFLIFNQQFVTLIRAGLPILQGLDLLADRLTDEKLGRHIRAVRDEVKTGTVLSDAFARQQRFSADLCDFGSGGREKRFAGRSSGALHRLPAADALAAQEIAGFAALSGYSSVSGHLPDRFSGDICRSELRYSVQQHGSETAGRDSHPDRSRYDGPELCTVWVRAFCSF